MSSCGGQPNTAFYNTKNYAFGDVTEHKTTPTTNGNNARCWGPGFFVSPTNSDCPSGWAFASQTSSGCSAGRRRPLCRYNNYPTDTRTKARCCLGAHRVGNMSSTGSFPASQRPCPPGHCTNSQDSADCKTAIENYCRTQFDIGSPDNALCWRYAKAKWVDGIDKFCRDSGAGNGSAIENDKNCREYAETDESHENLDDAMQAYCSSPLGRGKRLCSCYRQAVNLSEAATRLTDLGAPIACWSDACLTGGGYKNTGTIARMKNCGSFCGVAQDLKNLNIRGNLEVQTVCDGQTVAKAQDVAEDLEQKRNTSGNVTIVATDAESGLSSTSQTLLIIAAVLIVLVVISLLLWITLSGSSDEESVQIPAYQQPMFEEPIGGQGASAFVM